MKKELIKIDGMHCAHCVLAVKNELEDNGIAVAEIKLGEAVIEFDENKMDDSKLKDLISEAGYKLVNTEVV